MTKTNNTISISKLLNSHEWQIKDGCGPACVKMILNYVGVEDKSITQESIKKEVYTYVAPPWDGSYPEDVLKFFKKYFNDAEVLENQNIEAAEKFLDSGNLLMVLWTDRLPTADNEHEDGHYTIAAKIDKDYIQMIDPSNSERTYDSDGKVLTELDPGKKYIFEKRKTYKLNINHFIENWYDTLDETGRTKKGLLIRVNPNSLKTS